MLWYSKTKYQLTALNRFPPSCKATFLISCVRFVLLFGARHRFDLVDRICRFLDDFYESPLKCKWIEINFISVFYSLFSRSSTSFWFSLLLLYRFDRKQDILAQQFHFYFYSELEEVREKLSLSLNFECAFAHLSLTVRGLDDPQK